MTKFFWENISLSFKFYKIDDYFWEEWHRLEIIAHAQLSENPYIEVILVISVRNVTNVTLLLGSWQSKKGQSQTQ